MDDPGPQGREMRNMNPRREEELYKEYNNESPHFLVAHLINYKNYY